MKKLGKLLFITSLLLCFLIPRGWTQTQAKKQPDSIELKLKEIYTKREVMIQTEGNLHETRSHDSHA